MVNRHKVRVADLAAGTILSAALIALAYWVYLARGIP